MQAERTKVFQLRMRTPEGKGSDHAVVAASVECIEARLCLSRQNTSQGARQSFAMPFLICFPLPAGKGEGEGGWVCPGGWTSLTAALSPWELAPRRCRRTDMHRGDMPSAGCSERRLSAQETCRAKRLHGDDHAKHGDHRRGGEG